MKPFPLALLLLAPAQGFAQSAGIEYAVPLHQSGEGQVRDVAVARDGSAILVGGSDAADFAGTLGDAPAGSHDAFVVKLAPDGRVVWSRLLGGPGYDRAYAVELGPDGDVVVGGRAGAGFPTTAGALQPEFGGDVEPDELYGAQDGFVARLSRDGEPVWATYFGADDAGFLRDVAVDAAGDVYGAYCDGARPNPHVNGGAFQDEPPGPSFGVLAKIASDGRHVVWASYLGGTQPGYGMGTPSIVVDGRGRATVVCHTGCPDMPTTEGADRTLDGQSDMHVARFSARGTELEFATYLGGSDAEYGNTHNAVLVEDELLVVAATTKSADFPIRGAQGAQREHAGNGGRFHQLGDGFVAVLRNDGRLLASTFLGGSSGDGIEGVAVGSDGEIVVSGGTYSVDFPVVGGHPAPAPAPDRPNAFVARLRLADASIGIDWSTTFGGSGWDLALCAAVSPTGRVIVGGESKSADFAFAPAVEPRPSATKLAVAWALRPPRAAPRRLEAPFVTGRLLTPEGTPLGEQRARYRLSGDRGESSEVELTLSIRDDGTFVLPLHGSLQEGRGRELRIDLDQGADSGLGVVLAIPDELPARMHAFGDVALVRKPVLVAGVVVDSAGAPIAGAAVEVVGYTAPASFSWSADRRIGVVSGSDGSFEYREFAGVHATIALVGALGSLRGTVEAAVGAGDVVLTLVRPGVILGRVLHGANEAPANLRVVARPRDPAAPIVEAVPKRGGEFRLSDVPPGAYALEVRTGAWSEPLVVVADVVVHEGGLLRPAELQAIDLRDRLHETLVVLRDAAGRVLTGEIAFRPTGASDDAPWERLDVLGRARLATAAESLDVRATVAGFLDWELADTRGRAIFALQPLEKR